MTQRMTPEEFKAEYKRKGWTGRMLAERWQKSVAWISKIGNDPAREPHWDDAVRGLSNEKLKYSSIFCLPWVESWFNIDSEERPQRSDEMNDFISILEDFNRAATAEVEIVQRISVELWRHFGLEDNFSWLAVKNQIEAAAAKRNDSKGNIALKWIKAAHDQRLAAMRDVRGDLVIVEGIIPPYVPLEVTNVGLGSLSGCINAKGELLVENTDEAKLLTFMRGDSSLQNPENLLFVVKPSSLAGSWKYEGRDHSLASVRISPPFIFSLNTTKNT